jgi:hypothetical protein
MRAACLVAMFISLVHPCGAEEPSERKNWFNDPFFHVSSAMPDCPAPLGPFITEAERLVQSHHRAEKGTSCWLAGKCERPNYYEYDQDIAEAFRAAAASRPALFANTSLWVTVQGRIVFIEGCVTEVAAIAGLEAFARQLPNVQQAIATVRADPKAPPPYKRKPGE